MITISTNAMAKRHLEALGYETDITQHYIKYKGSAYGNRRDLFHCIDVVGVKPREWLNVQACDTENVSRAKKQAKQNQQVKTILQGPTDFEIWEFYRDSPDSGWWIRRWGCLTAGYEVVDFELKANEPSLDREGINAKAKDRRQKDKQKASDQENLRGLEADDTPF